MDVDNEDGEMGVDKEENDKEEEKGDDKATEVEEVEKQTDDQSQDSENKVVEPEKKEPRAMHKTTSIFLRNLSPTITKTEVEAVNFLVYSIELNWSHIFHQFLLRF